MESNHVSRALSGRQVDDVHLFAQRGRTDDPPREGARRREGLYRVRRQRRGRWTRAAARRADAVAAEAVARRRSPATRGGLPTWSRRKGAAAPAGAAPDAVAADSGGRPQEAPGGRAPRGAEPRDRREGLDPQRGVMEVLERRALAGVKLNRAPSAHRGCAGSRAAGAAAGAAARRRRRGSHRARHVVGRRSQHRQREPVRLRRRGHAARLHASTRPNDSATACICSIRPPARRARSTPRRRDYDQLTWSDDGVNLAVLRGDKVRGMKQKENVLLAWQGVAAAEAESDRPTIRRRTRRSRREWC